MTWLLRNRHEQFLERYTGNRWGITTSVIPPVSERITNLVAPAISLLSAPRTYQVFPGAWDASPADGALVYSYQWQRDAGTGSVFQNVTGETGTTYTVALTPAGEDIRCIVTATNARDSTSATSNVESTS